MVRTEISLFLKNVPGELGRLSSLFAGEGINIDAMMIQDASSYVQELFQARGKSLKRIASVARLLVDQTDNAIDLLSKNEYLFDIMPVIVIELENKPGALAEITTQLGKEKININYVYGSVAPRGKKCLFVVCPDNIEVAALLFKK